MMASDDDDDADLFVEVLHEDISDFTKLQNINWLTRLQELLASVKSHTSKQDLLLKLRYVIIQRVLLFNIRDMKEDVLLLPFFPDFNNLDTAY